MAVRQIDTYDARIVIRHLHRLVTAGPWQIDIAWAMSPHGYDEVKWAEGEAMLAELVNDDVPAPPVVAAAARWCQEAAMAAQRALAGQPHLLAKLGLPEA